MSFASMANFPKRIANSGRRLGHLSGAWGRCAAPAAVFCAVWTSLAAVCPSVGQAAPVIEAHSYYLLPGQSVAVTVTISGAPTDSAEGVNLYMQIGSGGPPNGGPDVGPVFAGVPDVVGPGTIFHGNNLGAMTDSLGPRIVYAGTVTASGTVPANGILGRVTVNTTAADVGSWALKLTGVLNTVFPPDGLDTDLADPIGNPAVVLDGWLHVWNLHQIVWSKGANGVWSDDYGWSNTVPLPAHAPNVTTDAVINTPHVVTLSGAGRTNSLTIIDGRLNMAAASQLQVTGTLSVEETGELVMAPGATLSAALLAANDGGRVEASIPLSGVDIAVAGGTLQALVGIEGGGNLVVGGAIDSLLETPRIRRSSLTIGTDGRVQITSTEGAASTSVIDLLQIAQGDGSFDWALFAPRGVAAGDSEGDPAAMAATVPEPAAWLAVVCAAVALSLARGRAAMRRSAGK